MNKIKEKKLRPAFHAFTTKDYKDTLNEMNKRGWKFIELKKQDDHYVCVFECSEKQWEEKLKEMEEEYPDCE